MKDRSNRNNVIVLSEGEDVANGVIDASVGALLQKVSESGALKEIHISDMGTHSRLFPLTIHCEIDLPTSINDASEYENVTSIIYLVLQMATNIGAMKLSRKQVDICDKNRKKYREEQRKAEEAEVATLKEDKARAERKVEKEKLSKMSIEDQRKYKEKQEKVEKQRKKKGLMRVMK